jgi:carboxypeptidase D
MKIQNKSAVFALVLILCQCFIASSAPLRKRIDLGPTSRTDPVQAAVSSPMSNDELEAFLKDFTTRCSNISRLFTIGKSVNGFPLYALEISDKPGVAEAEPNVKLIANIHGDETLGRTLTVGLAEWLCANYQTDPTAKKIIDQSHLYLVPSMNPDGYAAGKRTNANGVDLNRDFPDHFNNPTCTPTGKEQPETTAMMDWTQKTSFVSSISFHGGTYVVNYPWDGTKTGEDSYNACPDDKTFIELSKTYANSNSNILNGEFPGGITNGAEWYVVYGGMQDWNYVRTGTMELTVEIGQKTPPDSQLASMFEDNLQSMLNFITKSAFGGVRGKVMAMVGTKLVPVQASIVVNGIARVSKSGATFGDYYRPLAAGRYSITVKRAGYKTATATVLVPSNGKGVIKNFVLKK